MLQKEEIQNLIAIVATHPTPQGVGSPEGEVKTQLIIKLKTMLIEMNKSEEEVKK
jgi:hypothetical protein